MKYLVVERGYEYNDEYYYTTEGDYYQIVSKLYDTKEEAQNEANKQILRFIKMQIQHTVSGTFDFYEWGGEVSERLKNACINICGSESEISSSVSDEDILRLVAISKEPFFYVIEIEE